MICEAVGKDGERKGGVLTHKIQRLEGLRCQLTPGCGMRTSGTNPSSAPDSHVTPGELPTSQRLSFPIGKVGGMTYQRYRVVLSKDGG